MEPKVPNGCTAGLLKLVVVGGEDPAELDASKLDDGGRLGEGLQRLWLRSAPLLLLLVCS
jgi:hypothetical protein